MGTLGEQDSRAIFQITNCWSTGRIVIARFFQGILWLPPESSCSLYFFSLFICVWIFCLHVHLCTTFTHAVYHWGIAPSLSNMFNPSVSNCQFIGCVETRRFDQDIGWQSREFRMWGSQQDSWPATFESPISWELRVSCRSSCCLKGQRSVTVRRTAFENKKSQKWIRKLLWNLTWTKR